MCSGKLFNGAANENWNFSLDECCDGKYQLKRTMNTTTSVNSILLLLVVAFVILYIVWTQKELHIERLSLDEAPLQSALPTAIFFKTCILPELLGKW